MAERDFSGGVLWPRNLWSFTFRHRTQHETRILVIRYVAQSPGNSDASIPESGNSSGRRKLE
jgi:hypothetical protein